MSLRLVESLATTEPLAEIFSDRALIAAMLQFEVALSRVEARLGVIPAAAADAVALAAAPDDFDAGSIARAARENATITIPLVDALIARVGAIDPAAASFVHWGATSQDVSDTALVLCLARALPVLQGDHTQLLDALRRLSDAHAHSVMLGRTLLQPAPPITFGLKAAGWFAAVTRAGARVIDAMAHARILQFGGAAGTLAALGTHGPAIAADLARELSLKDPGAPWHAHRDRLATVVAACGVYCGVLGKVARDVTLLMQFEVGEAAEPGGRSSTMPHKRNPANCAIALAAATRVPGLVAAFLAGMPQEHERGLGTWAADAATLSATVQSTGAALLAMREAMATLRVDPERMRTNIAATNNAVFAERATMALAPEIGRDQTKRIVADALETSRREGKTFDAALTANRDVAGMLSTEILETLGSPESYLGAAEEFRQRLLKQNAE